MTAILTPPASHLDLDAQELAEHPHNDTRRFPDGEVYVQLALDGVDSATVLHAGMPEPNDGMMHLYGVLDRLREEGVPAEVAFTYMPYGMQDDVFFPGTLNRARAILRKLVDYYDVQQVHAVDAHFAHRGWAADLPFQNIHAFPRIDQAVQMEEYTVVGPDLGAVERFGIEGFRKERTSAEEVTLEGDLDVEGRNVLVFDDIIETGGTMAAAYDRLVEQGAERIEAAAVHGVLEQGVERVADQYDRLHLANTVDRDAASVSIEPLLRDRLNL